MVSLARATEDVLRQGLALLLELNGESFAAVAPEPYGASIGQHYRHVLDHFLCLESGIATGEFDYDNRQRNPRRMRHLRLVHFSSKCSVERGPLVRFDAASASRPCSPSNADLRLHRQMLHRR